MWRSHSASWPACFTNAAERASSSAVHPAMMASTFLPLISDGACGTLRCFNVGWLAPRQHGNALHLYLYSGCHLYSTATPCNEYKGDARAGCVAQQARGTWQIQHTMHAVRHSKPAWGCTAAVAAVVSASSAPEVGALATGAAEAAAASLAAGAEAPAGGANRLSVGAAAVEAASAELAAGVEAKLKPARRETS